MGIETGLTNTGDDIQCQQDSCWHFLGRGHSATYQMFAHTLNLATQRGIDVNQVNRVLGRVRRVVSFFPQKYDGHKCLKIKAGTTRNSAA